MRHEIRAMIAAIEPFDSRERQDQKEALAWIDSGAELCRIAKPATPPRHLVSYFAVLDGDQILLVDHIKAGLWLPTGGHVDPGEDPRETVRREAREELGLEADFLVEAPLLITAEETVGQTAGHVDVSLWFALRGDRSTRYVFDHEEFHRVKWFDQARPPAQTDPNLGRFLAKLGAL